MQQTPVTSTSATVQIVDATGRSYAKASFVPAPLADIGPARPLVQPPVRVVAGAVYYADNAGAVRRLKPDGSDAVVATFPLTNAQQELSYAVSPDGSRLIAIVLSTPPLANPPPQHFGDPIYQDGGHWTLDLERATSGGATTNVLHRDLGTAYPAPTQIVGWDGQGPLATLNTHLGAQQALPSTHVFGDLIHLGLDGTHLDPVGGSGCGAVVDFLPNDSVVCDADWWHFSVRTSSGATLWQAAFPASDYYEPVFLAPDANAVAAMDLVVTSASMASASRVSGAASVIAQGWLDSRIVVAAAANGGGLGLYAVQGTRLVKIRDLALKGTLAGVL